MKKRRLGIMVAVGVAILGLAALAAEQGTAKRIAPSSSLRVNTSLPDQRVFVLKAKGKPIAELRALSGTVLEITPTDESGQAEYNEATGTVVASHGLVLKISSGTNSIVVHAEELETVRDTK